MAWKHRETFEAPNIQDLDALKVGDTVKVCHQLSERQSERFWCHIKEIEDVPSEDNGFICAEVDNDLIHDHGFGFQDLIQFHKHDIYMIYED